MLLAKGAGLFYRASQCQPAGEIRIGRVLGGGYRQPGDQSPDGFVVGPCLFATQQWRDEDTFAGGGEGLITGFQRLGPDELAAYLLLDRQFAKPLEGDVL